MASTARATPRIPKLQDELDWDVSLHARRGARRRLVGITVYYEFNWRKYRPDRRMQFPNGKVLAQRVIDDCPDDKRPALLLTDRKDIKEGARSTPSYYVVVINLPRYLERAAGNAAVSYLAETLGPITQAGELHALAVADPQALCALIKLHLTAADIADWANGDEQRISDLRAITHADATEAAIDALRAISTLTPEIIEVLSDLARTEPGRENRLNLLRALTSDLTGRDAAGEVLGERLEDRLADARKAVDEYTKLLDDQTSIETDLQEFLEGKPWLLGLDYARVLPKQPLPRGVADFLLARFDGFYDLLELKDPNDPIVVVPSTGSSPPSASKVTLSKSLGQALAQVHLYRDTMRHEQVTEHHYGLPETRDPRVIIILGTSNNLDDTQRRILHELNCSLHRVEIIPYDIVGKRAAALLKAVEQQIAKVGRG